MRDQFDSIFSTVTGYEVLDRRIARTKANKGNLLMRVFDASDFVLVVAGFIKFSGGLIETYALGFMVG